MFLFSAAFALVSISSSAAPSACYSYKENSIRVEWTGFKFTEKTAVKGALLKVETKTNPNPKSISEMLTSTSFVVDALSVDSGNVARDLNLKESFFKLMKTTSINGKISAYDKNVAQVEINMNGIKKIISFKTNTTETKVTATGSIDLLDFAMQNSLKKINEVCYELHKGKDGVSKTWSTVDLNITAEISSVCNKKG